MERGGHCGVRGVRAEGARPAWAEFAALVDHIGDGSAWPAPVEQAALQAGLVEDAAAAPGAPEPGPDPAEAAP